MTIKNQQNLRITVVAARIYVSFIVLAFIAILLVAFVRDGSIMDVLLSALLVLAAVGSIIPAWEEASKKLKTQGN